MATETNLGGIVYVASRPATIRKDGRVWAKYQAGMDPKEIRRRMELTEDEYYKAIAREKKRQMQGAKRRGR